MANTIKIGNLEIDNLKVGTLSVDALYIGDVKIYPPTPTPPTPTLKWVSYSEGDAIPSESVYKTYGFRIPTQTLLDIFENGKYLEIDLNSEEVDHEQHSLSIIVFPFPYEGETFLFINGQSQEISYDPESDEYLEIIFSDYGVNYNYNVSYFNYGEQGDTEMVYEFPFGMDLYEEDTPTPQTLQWVTFSAGDTIPSTLDIYGIKFSDAENAMNTFGNSSQPFYIEPYRRVFDIYIGGKYYDQISTSFEVVFSEISSTYTGDYLNFNNDIVVYQSSDSIQLYIYA